METYISLLIYMLQKTGYLFISYKFSVACIIIKILLFPSGMSASNERKNVERTIGILYWLKNDFPMVKFW